MVQINKKNSEAFGDILAGLDADVPDRSSRTPASIDVSWIESLRAAPARKNAPEQRTQSITPETASDPANRLRSGLGSMSWGWRSGSGSHASPNAEVYAREAARLSEPAETGPTAAARANPAGEREEAVETGASSQPVHALRRLLSQIPWRWRSGDRSLAPADEEPAVGSAAEAAPAPAVPPKPRAPKTEEETMAEGLGWRADLAVVDLRRIRRDFAKKNHPDRFGAAQRVSAARRMTIANMLIDERLKGKSSAH